MAYNDFHYIFFAFVHANPYWIVMLAPFLLLIMFNRGENFKINIILEIVTEAAMILVQGFFYSYLYFYEQSFSHLIFKNTDIKLGQGAENIVDVMEFFGVSGYIPKVYAVFIACAGALLILNNPWKYLNNGGRYAGRMLVQKRYHALPESD
ncbi:MAG: hypothetical protein HFH75_02960 [Lachnospiraceae bacterium]|jgi:hypothetical protein|nr:hypothetical protein [Lachnospiraceae bacterium]